MSRRQRRPVTGTDVRKWLSPHTIPPEIAAEIADMLNAEIANEEPARQGPPPRPRMLPEHEERRVLVTHWLAQRRELERRLAELPSRTPAAIKCAAELQAMKARIADLQAELPQRRTAGVTEWASLGVCIDRLIARVLADTGCAATDIDRAAMRFAVKALRHLGYSTTTDPNMARQVAKLRREIRQGLPLLFGRQKNRSNSLN